MFNFYPGLPHALQAVLVSFPDTLWGGIGNETQQLHEHNTNRISSITQSQSSSVIDTHLVGQKVAWKVINRSSPSCLTPEHKHSNRQGRICLRRRPRAKCMYQYIFVLRNLRIWPILRLRTIVAWSQDTHTCYAISRLPAQSWECALQSWDCANSQIARNIFMNNQRITALYPYEGQLDEETESYYLP